MKQKLIKQSETLKERSFKHYVSAQSLFQLNNLQLQQAMKSYTPFRPDLLDIAKIHQSSSKVLLKTSKEIYYGEASGDLKKGLGISVYNRGNIFQGICRNNIREGKGVELYPTGNLYMGQFKENKKNGEGTFYWFKTSPLETTFGQLQSGLKVYSGQWFFDQVIGNGRFLNQNGNYYQGQFRLNLKHGQGRQEFFNGDFYLGSFVNGKPNGYGEYYWANGRIYQGNFQAGKRCGQGVWYKSKNLKERYQGNYFQDKKNGFGTYYFQDGSIYRGYFSEDFMDGEGVIIVDNVQTKCRYERNEPQSLRKNTRSPKKKQVSLSPTAQKNKCRRGCCHKSNNRRHNCCEN